MDKTKIQYYLKSRGGDLREVIIRFSFGYKLLDNMTGQSKYKPFVYDTGVKTQIEDWDDKQGVPKSTSKFMEVLNVREKLETLYAHLINQNTKVTPDLLKTEMDKLLGRKKEVKSITGLVDFIYTFILEEEEEKPDDKFEYSYNTRKNYRSLKRMIAAFEEVFGFTLIAENIDKETYLKFQEFCQDRTNKNNTVWTYMKNLDAVLRKIKAKYSVPVFDSKTEIEKKKVINQKVEDKIYFDFDDIQRVIDYQPKTKRLREIRLILLTLLFSGARYSDIFKVVPKNTYNKDNFSFRYAHFITAKNPTEVVVPFVKPLEDAWNEKKRTSLQKMPDTKFNEGAKELCRLIGFTQMKTMVFTNSRGSIQFEEKAHFKYVSSHIGRRSFVSNFINVVSPTLISKITGHQFKMRDVIFKYNKISPLKGAVLFMKFAKKLYDDEDWKDEFPIKLVA